MRGSAYSQIVRRLAPFSFSESGRIWFGFGWALIAAPEAGIWSVSRRVGKVWDWHAPLIRTSETRPISERRTGIVSSLWLVAARFQERAVDVVVNSTDRCAVPCPYPLEPAVCNMGKWLQFGKQVVDNWQI